LYEADQQIIAAVNYLVNRRKCKVVVVGADDTDVAIRLTSLYDTLVSATNSIIGLLRGKSSNKQWVDLYGVSVKIKETFPFALRGYVLKSLTGFHAFTGSDHTSQFEGVTKACAWTNLTRACEIDEVLGKEFLLALAAFGTPDFEKEREVLQQFSTSKAIVLSDALKRENSMKHLITLERLLCCVYGCSDYSTANEARHMRFCGYRSRPHLNLPTQNALVQHILRSDLGAEGWYLALHDPTVVDPDPTGRGWISEDGSWRAVGITCQHAPKELLSRMTCGCKTGCTSNRCKCMKIGMACSLACSCTGCNNGKPHPPPPINIAAEEGATAAAEAAGDEASGPTMDTADEHFEDEDAGKKWTGLSPKRADLNVFEVLFSERTCRGDMPIPRRVSSPSSSLHTLMPSDRTRQSRSRRLLIVL
jgi:hypothetical protein